MEKIRKHFYFSGRVQGVGFRYRSYYIAQSMGLTGWVRNLWDDRVEMELQGTREEIREMVERLSQQSFVEIEGIEAREIPREEEFGVHVTGERNGWFIPAPVPDTTEQRPGISGD